MIGAARPSSSTTAFPSSFIDLFFLLSVILAALTEQCRASRRAVRRWAELGIRKLRDYFRQCGFGFKRNARVKQLKHKVPARLDNDLRTDGPMGKLVITV